MARQTIVCPSCPRRFRKMARLKDHFRRRHAPNGGARKVTRKELGF